MLPGTAGLGISKKNVSVEEESLMKSSGLEYDDVVVAEGVVGHCETGLDIWTRGGRKSSNTPDAMLLRPFCICCFCNVNCKGEVVSTSSCL